MSSESVSLGYVILYVRDVSTSMSFYEKAFGLSRRFFHDENGNAYGELETGAVRLSFASVQMAKEHVDQEVIAASPQNAPLGFEIAFVTADVEGLFRRVLDSGATSVREPAKKPWGQTVAYVRDPDGYLVELCTPLP